VAFAHVVLAAIGMADVGGVHGCLTLEFSGRQKAQLFDGLLE